MTVAEHWNGRPSVAATSAPARLMRKVEENGVTWRVGKRMLHGGGTHTSKVYSSEFRHLKNWDGWKTVLSSCFPFLGNFSRSELLNFGGVRGGPCNLGEGVPVGGAVFNRPSFWTRLL